MTLLNQKQCFSGSVAVIIPRRISSSVTIRNTLKFILQKNFVDCLKGGIFTEQPSAT